MCGGRGRRLGGAVEKPLVEVAGQPMVEHVCQALVASRVEQVYAAVSPHTPATRTHLAERVPSVNQENSADQARSDDNPDLHVRDIRLVDTPGDGYVADLDTALDTTDTPVLTVAADLPLLSDDAVDAVLDAYAAISTGTDDAREVVSLAVLVPTALKRAVGASVDDAVEREGRELVSSGVNIVAGRVDETHVSRDVGLTVNVNRPRDIRVAEALS